MFLTINYVDASYFGQKNEWGDLCLHKSPVSPEI